MKRHKIFVILILFIIPFGACNDKFLDVQPTVANNADDAFNNPSEVIALMNGVYTLARDLDFTLGIILFSEVKGEDIFLIPDNLGWFSSAYQYTENPYSGDQNNFWFNGYKIIANCNQLIEKIPQSTAFSDEFKNHYLAEAKAVRAYVYFQLVRLFGQPYSVDPNGKGVPLTLKPLSKDDDFPGRSSVRDVYAVILDDLEFAESNFDTNIGNSIYRMTLPAIQGLLARVHLNMEHWAEASSYAALARSSFNLSSMSELLDGFADPTSEWMWAFDMRSDDNEGYTMVPSFFDTREDGYNTLRADADFLYLFYESNDNRIYQFSADGVNLSYSEYGYEVFKFLHRKTWDMDQVLMRASEMYLIGAEAEAELKNYKDARILLNIIKGRAGLLPVDESVTGRLLIDEIMLERKKELFGEGFRFFDMTRKKQPLIRTESSHWWPISLPANDPRMVLPIPQDEIDANPNISEADQNEAYR